MTTAVDAAGHSQAGKKEREGGAIEESGRTSLTINYTLMVPPHP